MKGVVGGIGFTCGIDFGGGGFGFGGGLKGLGIGWFDEDL